MRHLSAPMLLGAMVFGGVIAAGCSISHLVFDLPPDGAGGAGGTGGASGTGGATSSSSSSGGGGGSLPVGICGNGVLEAGEQCDDNNTTAGDGCSDTCGIEPADDCPGAPVALAPPGLTLAIDMTGMAGNRTPTCMSIDAPDIVYAITPTVSGTVTATLKGSGDKSLSVRSLCPSSLPFQQLEIACSSGAFDVQIGFFAHAGQTYYLIVDGAGPLFDLELKLERCGDGIASGLEQCDDPNDPSCKGCVNCKGTDEFLDPATGHCYRLVSTPTLNRNAARKSCVSWGGDLAALSSKAEYDFIVGQMSQPLTTSTWIDGTVGPACSYSATNGEPWRSEWAPGEPSTTTEQCVALQSTLGYQMADRSCSSAMPYLCERVPAGGCGDGIVQPYEECDDGNTAPGDGCEPDCKRFIPCDTAAGEVVNSANSHCYKLVIGGSAPKTWHDAKLDCETWGGTLVVVSSQSEQDFLTSHMVGPAWIGAVKGTFADGTVFWETPVSTCFTSWAVGEPSNPLEECVVTAIDGTWSDQDCTVLSDYVCER